MASSLYLCSLADFAAAQKHLAAMLRQEHNEAHTSGAVGSEGRYPHLGYGLAGLGAVVAWAHELGVGHRGDTSRTAQLLHWILVPTDHVKALVAPIVGPTDAHDDDESLLEVVKADIDSLPDRHFSQGWLTWDRTKFRPNDRETFMVQLDASGLVRSALPPHRHSVFVACTRDDHAGQLVPTAPHLLLHGILAIKHLHEHHTHTAAAFELLALVLLAQLCALPRHTALGDSQAEWREVARHFDREALDSLRAFVEHTLDPAGELATRSAATWYHHEGAQFETEWPALKNDLHTAINWIRQRFSEWLPSQDGPAVASHSLGDAAQSRYFPQDRRLASSSRF